MLETWADDSFERGMDLGEQSPDPVRGGRDLLDEIVVETAEHGQLSGLLVGQDDRAQSVGHGAGGLGDDRRDAGIGLGLARVEIGDAPHGQPMEVSGHHAHVAGDGKWQCADRGGLVDDHEDLAMARDLLDESTELRLVLRQGLVQELLAGAVDRYGVVSSLSDVDADEHLDTVVAWEHGFLRYCGGRGSAGLSCGSRAPHPRCARPGRRRRGAAWPGPYQRPSGAYRVPAATPHGSSTTAGKEPCRARQASHPDPASDRGYEEGNG